MKNNNISIDLRTGPKAIRYQRRINQCRHDPARALGPVLTALAILALIMAIFNR